MMSAPKRPPEPSLSSRITQRFPPRPAFTARDIPDLSGKVYIVTSPSAGVGRDIVRILYSKNAIIYMFAQSSDKASDAITEIKKRWPDSTGSLFYQHLDLSDLSTMKKSVETFTSREPKLHALFNNAGVQEMAAEQLNDRTAQGHEIHMGVNVLGPFLLTKLLTPTLVATAKTELEGSVRVVWESSSSLEMVGEKDYGITPAYQDYWPTLKPLERHAITKVGSWLYGVEFATRHKVDGVVSCPCNPGRLRSNQDRDGGRWFKWLINICFGYPSVNGAFTELFSAFSPTITIEKSGDWVIPWGRLYPLRKDMEAARRSKENGGNGHARKFWEWSEEQVKSFI